MNVKVGMKNPKTGEVKMIKVGWSWVLFLFSTFFGLPLFLRKLNVWGAVFLTFGILGWVVGIMAISSDNDGLQFAAYSLTGLGWVLQIFIGLKGNEMTVKNYLENNWVFVEPDSDLTK